MILHIVYNEIQPSEDIQHIINVQSLMVNIKNKHRPDKVLNNKSITICQYN